MRKMKDSGIEWIGEIPNDWTVCKIKHFVVDEDGVRIGPFGSALTNRLLENGEYNVYSQANLIAGDFSSTKHTIDEDTFSDLKNYEVLADDICVSMMGTIGKCMVVPNGIKPGIMDSHLIKIRLTPRVNPKFFEYVYDKDNSGLCFVQMKRDSKGTIMDGLNSTIVKNLFFPLPSHDIQNIIVDYLDKKCAEIDAIIAAKEKTNELLKEHRQSIIYEAVTKGLDPTVPMKDSGVEWIGEIPESWELIRAKYFAAISNGSDPKTEGEIPVYGSGSESFKTCGEYKEGPAVLLGRKGATLHIPHYVEGQYWNVDTAFDVKTNEDICLLKFYYYVSICFDYKLYIAMTTLPGMTQTNYGNMYIPLPSIDVQTLIVEHIEKQCTKLDALISTNDNTIEKLKEYRQSVIYEAVTGKVEI